MSSGMNIEDAKKVAEHMTYKQAIMNCLYARCVPYRKATKIKMEELLKLVEQFGDVKGADRMRKYTYLERPLPKHIVGKIRADVIDEYVEFYQNVPCPQCSDCNTDEDYACIKCLAKIFKENDNE